MFENSTGEEEISDVGITIPESINKRTHESIKSELRSFLFSIPITKLVFKALFMILTTRGIDITKTQNKLAIILFAIFVSYINAKYINIKIEIMQQKI